MSEKTINYSRSIPVRQDVDIFIAGGGPSGVAAAVVAARQGCKVFLAEGHTFFGGLGTAALVPVFLHFANGVDFLSAGIGEEIYNKLRTQTHLYLDHPASVVNNNPEVLKRIYDDMVQEAGVGFTFQTQVIGIEVEDGHVQYAICNAKSGMFAVRAKMFIDCTGDGDLATWAGAPFEKGDDQGRMMPGTLCGLWSDINWEEINKSAMPEDFHREKAWGQDVALEQAFKDGVFTIHDLHLPGIFQIGKHIGCGNLVHTFGVDGTDETSLTKALIRGRQGQLEYQKYYREYLKGFENMELVATGSLLGLRDTRRIMGDYRLNVDDFEKRAIFPDEIGRYSYPIDIHPLVPDKASYARFEKEFFAKYRYRRGESYGIPYRVLTPRNVQNLLVAGRCVSADRYIQGSIRVMAGCYITGQAAGMAATLAVEKQTTTRGVDVRDLQGRLKKIGAFLPNYKEVVETEN